uniref:Uncharacterized protein n=1 Tax=uncultured marine crenarchaeote HF4000_ANIW141J13 TaxID=455577 RepID=B3T5J0_9ARCH|nr:hypothetical protein ALOHA_HF4000ANIW141J13ctg1g18 [uncultured marine crenarchaeote HF4000_ANIW141J13]
MHFLLRFFAYLPRTFVFCLFSHEIDTLYVIYFVILRYLNYMIFQNKRNY